MPRRGLFIVVRQDFMPSFPTFLIGNPGDNFILTSVNVIIAVISGGVSVEYDLGDIPATADFGAGKMLTFDHKDNTKARYILIGKWEGLKCVFNGAFPHGPHIGMNQWCY